MLLVQPSWKLAEHDEACCIVFCSFFTYPLQKPFSDHIDGDWALVLPIGPGSILSMNIRHVSMYVTKLMITFCIWTHAQTARL
jgi:hypothetical protein